MVRHSNTSSKKLTLDALMRNPKTSMRIPMLVLAEPSIVALTGMKTTPIYENLTSLALANLKSNPTGERAPQHIRNALRYSSRFDDSHSIHVIIVDVLNIIKSIEYRGDREYASSVAARSLIYLANEIHQDYKEDTIGTLNEILQHQYPQVRENIVAFFTSCTQKDLSSEQVKSGLELVTLSKEEVSRMIKKAEHSSVTDHAISRLYEIQSSQEAARLSEMEAAVEGRIVSGAEILDIDPKSREILLPTSLHYDPDEFMEQAWQVNFLKTLSEDPSSDAAKAMLLRIRNDSIGDEISEKRITSALSLLSMALEQTSTIGARKVLITMIGIINKIHTYEFYSKIRKETIEPVLTQHRKAVLDLLGAAKNKTVFSSLLALCSDILNEDDFSSIMETRKDKTFEEAKEHNSFIYHIRIPKQGNALIRVTKNEDEFKVEALGYLALEVITDDPTLIQQSMESYQKKMGNNISQVLDHEEGGIYRFLLYKSYSPDDCEKFSEIFTKSINRAAVEKIYSSFICGFRHQPLSNPNEIVPTIKRLAEIENTIDEANFVRLISENPETDQAKERIEKLLEKTKSEKSEQAIHDALSLLSTTMKSTNDYGKKMVAVAIAEIYYCAPKEMMDSLLPQVESILGENIEDHISFLSDLYDPNDSEIFYLIQPLIQNYVDEDGKGKLELMKMKKKFDIALSDYSKDPADPEAALYLQDVLDALSSPQMQEEKVHIHAIGSILEALKNVDEKKEKQIAANKAANALSELVYLLPKQHQEEALDYAATWLPLHCKTTQQQLIKLLLKTNMETDPAYADVLFGLSRPNPKELEHARSKSNSSYVRQKCKSLIEEKQIKLENRKRPLITATETKAFAAEFYTRREPPTNRKMGRFISAMDEFFTLLGEEPIPDLDDVLDYAAELKLKPRQERYENEYDVAAMNLQKALMHLDKDSRDEAAYLYRINKDPGEAQEFEAEDTKPGIPIPKGKIHHVSDEAAKTLDAMKSFMDNLTNPVIEEQLSELAESISLLKAEEQNIILESVDGISSQLEHLPQEQREVALENFVKYTLAIMENASNDLYAILLPKIREKTASISSVRNKIFSRLAQTQYDENDMRSIAISFAILDLSMDEIAKLNDSAKSTSVKTYAHHEYNKAWRDDFVKLFQDYDESEYAKRVLNSLINSVLGSSDQRVEYTASTIACALEVTNDEGEKKLLHALSHIYSEIESPKQKHLFKEYTINSSESKKDELESVFSFVDDQENKEKQKQQKKFPTQEKEGIEHALLSYAQSSYEEQLRRSQIKEDDKIYSQLSTAINGYRSDPASKGGLDYLKVVSTTLPKITNNQQFYAITIAAMLEPIPLSTDEKEKHKIEKNVVLGILYLLKNLDKEQRTFTINHLSKLVIELPSLRAKMFEALISTKCSQNSPNSTIACLLDIMNPVHNELDLLTQRSKSELIRNLAQTRLNEKATKKSTKQTQESTSSYELNDQEMNIVNGVLDTLGIVNTENEIEAFRSLDPAERDFIIQTSISEQLSLDNWRMRTYIYEKLVASIYSKLNLDRSTAQERTDFLFNNPNMLNESQRKTISLIVNKGLEEEITRSDLEYASNWARKRGSSGLRELIYQASPLSRIVRILSNSRKHNGEIPINPNDRAMFSQILESDLTQDDFADLLKGVREKSPDRVWIFKKLKERGIDFSIESIQEFVAYAKITLDLFEYLSQNAKTPSRIRENTESTYSYPSSKNKMGDAGLSYAIEYSNSEKIAIDAVFDGVSGQMKPDFASSRAKEIFELGIFSGMIDGIKNAAIFCELADQSIAMENLNTGLRDPRMGAATTIALTIMQGNKLYAMHVGDSRFRVYRGDKVVAGNSDHSLLSEVFKSVLSNVSSGNEKNAWDSLTLMFSESDADLIIDYVKVNNPTIFELADHIYWNCPPIRKDNISSSLGGSMRHLTISNPINLQDGDVVALCTDGISDTVCPHNIALAISSYEPANAVSAIIEISNKRVKDMPGVDDCGCLLRGKDDDKYIILRAYEEEIPRNIRRSTIPFGMISERPMK
jgi:serine/threonine protein phosphatase PrpC